VKVIRHNDNLEESKDTSQKADSPRDSSSSQDIKDIQRKNRLQTQLTERQIADAEKSKAICIAETALETQREKVNNLLAKVSEFEQEIYSRKRIAERDVFDTEVQITTLKKSVLGILKQDLYDIRSMPKPPNAVKLTMELVSTCISVKLQTLGWESVKNIMRRDDFLVQVSNIQISRLGPSLCTKIKETFFGNKELSVARVERANKSCGILLRWIQLLFRFTPIFSF
jgi:dynein heavy chain 1